MTLRATTRRGFLRRAAGAIAALCGAVWLGPGCRDAGDARSAQVQRALEAYFGEDGVEVAARTGRVALEKHPDPAGLRTEALALGESAAAGASAQDAVDAWRRQVDAESAGLETVSLANWQVAPTEMRLCALAALVARE